jgi:hypothetical protein
MAPAGVHVVYTSFSPMMAFLWNVLKEHIFSKIPETLAIPYMVREWMLGSRAFKGLAVLYQEMHRNDNLSSFIVQDGRDEEWHKDINFYGVWRPKITEEGMELD